MRALAKFMAVLLPCGTIAYSADLFRVVGLLFYPEQFFGAMFGLAMALCYLHVPAGPGRAREGSRSRGTTARGGACRSSAASISRCAIRC